MVKVAYVALVLVVVGCTDAEHNPSGGNDSSDDDDGAGVESDSGVAEGPDAAPGPVAAADACAQFAEAYCRSTVGCDRFDPPPGQDTVPGCMAVQQPYCLERRSAPVPPAELAACRDGIDAQPCAATTIIPGQCRLLWDTIVPDAGVPDAGLPDAGAPDGGLPDAGTPGARP